MSKTLFYSVIVALFIGACAKDKETPVEEIPEGIIRTDTSPIYYARIINLLPSAQNAGTVYPILFSDTVQKKIITTAETDVYITFVAERAFYKNTVGWYSYPVGQEPKSAKDINIHVLFPNVSGKGEGGELLQGDKLQLGETKFPKGTVIGFFIIIKGWKDGYINYNADTYYTDSQLNATKYQQHVLFKEKNGGRIVLGFEDMPYNVGDADYNDILFTIADNKEGLETVYFDLKSLPQL
jgi:hypothetical protein